MRASIWIGIGVTVMALGAAWREKAQAESKFARAAAVQAQLQRLREGVKALKPTGRGDSAPATVMAPATRPHVSVTWDTISGLAKADYAARRQKLEDVPNLQVLYGQSQRARYRFQFAALFRRLGLGRDQQEAFVAALADWDVRTFDLDTIRKQQGLPRNDPGLKAQRAEADIMLKRAMEAVLGPDANEVVRDYTRLDRVREHVANWSALLSRVGSPLTLQQMEALTAVIDECSHQPSRDPTRLLSSTEWQKVAAQAQAILSSEQWRTLQEATPAASPRDSAADTALEELLTTLAGPNQ